MITCGGSAEVVSGVGNAAVVSGAAGDAGAAVGSAGSAAAGGGAGCDATGAGAGDAGCAATGVGVAAQGVRRPAAGRGARAPPAPAARRPLSGSRGAASEAGSARPAGAGLLKLSVTGRRRRLVAGLGHGHGRGLRRSGDGVRRHGGRSGGWPAAAVTRRVRGRRGCRHRRCRLGQRRRSGRAASAGPARPRRRRRGRGPRGRSAPDRRRSGGATGTASAAGRAGTSAAAGSGSATGLGAAAGAGATTSRGGGAALCWVCGSVSAAFLRASASARRERASFSRSSSACGSRSSTRLGPSVPAARRILRAAHPRPLVFSLPAASWRWFPFGRISPRVPRMPRTGQSPHNQAIVRQANNRHQHAEDRAAAFFRGCGSPAPAPDGRIAAAGSAGSGKNPLKFYVYRSGRVGTGSGALLRRLWHGCATLRREMPARRR